jgi:hypothetical protein
MPADVRSVLASRPMTPLYSYIGGMQGSRCSCASIQVGDGCTGLEGSSDPVAPQLPIIGTHPRLPSTSNARDHSLQFGSHALVRGHLCILTAVTKRMLKLTCARAPTVVPTPPPRHSLCSLDPGFLLFICYSYPCCCIY